MIECSVDLCTVIDYLLPFLVDLFSTSLKNEVARRYLRALTDSAVHGLVAAASWIIIRFDISSKLCLEIFICALLSMLIDVDHFIAAKSTNLKVRTKMNTLFNRV